MIYKEVSNAAPLAWTSVPLCVSQKSKSPLLHTLEHPNPVEYIHYPVLLQKYYAMHFTTLHAYFLMVLSCVPMSAMALPKAYAHGSTLSAVHVNRNLGFVNGPKGTATTKLAGRGVVFTSGGRDDYCGETTPDETFGPDAPLAADCLAIGAYMETIDGYYTVSPADFDGSSGWVTIASSGTCTFAIKFDVAADTQTVLIGTNDVQFYINVYAPDAQDGRIEAAGGIACNYNGQVLLLDWGMIHS